MQMHLQGTQNTSETGQVFLFAKKGPDNPVSRIPLGELLCEQNGGNAQFFFTAGNIEESGFSLENILGAGICFPSSRYAASCWTKEPFEELLQGAVLLREENTVRESTVQEKIQIVEEEVPKLQNCQVVKQETKRPLHKIDLKEIKRLPKRNWYLCNNSFLIHGYFNYHYLILHEVQTETSKKLYLGVPGVYERPERSMALLFGFPEFAAEEDLTEGIEKNTEEYPEGTFGFWLCLLDV